MSQGVLGYNLFIYCLNNPVSRVDSSGKLSMVLSGYLTPELLQYDEEIGGGVGSAALAIGVAVTAGVAVDTIVSNAEKRNARTYSVYFLQDGEGTIQYVGRVTDSGYDARMAYHNKTRGLTPANRIPGLSYEEARGLEEMGMIFYHTRNALNPINNQIHGIAIKNPNRERCFKAALDYLSNRAENWVINLFQ